MSSLAETRSPTQQHNYDPDYEKQGQTRRRRPVHVKHVKCRSPSFAIRDIPPSLAGAARTPSVWGLLSPPTQCNPKGAVDAGWRSTETLSNGYLHRFTSTQRSTIVSVAFMSVFTSRSN
jgi:hypothetical protein